MLMSGLWCQPAAVANTETSCVAPDVAAMAIAHLLASPSSVELGRQYLQQFPDERDARRLVRLLGIQDVVEDARIAVYRLRLKVSADFENGHTVRIRNWVMSRTEARLNALTVIAP
jgi:hypothetical protein